MLQNAYFLAKIGADTAENEQHFAEILPTDAVEEAAALHVREEVAPLLFLCPFCCGNRSFKTFPAFGVPECSRFEF